MTIEWTNPNFTIIKDKFNERAKIFKTDDKMVIEFNADKRVFECVADAADHLNAATIIERQSLTSHVIDYLASHETARLNPSQIPRRLKVLFR